MKKSLIGIFFIFLSVSVFAQLTVTFPSTDGITVTGDWYPVSSSLPVILLCHQNGFSRGEYSETALRLNKFGFNCLAIDQRTGNEVNGIKNETASAAKRKNLSTDYLDSEKDIVAAIDYLFKKYDQQVILFGSSYSASLALIIASKNPNVSSVIAFSPGEYFKDSLFVRKNIPSLLKPVFITSSLEESEKVTDLVKDVNSTVKIQYVPSTNGEHGSKALWSESKDNQQYWIALMSFLDRIKSGE